MKVQYEPVMLGVLTLLLGNAFLGIPFFSGFPIDILSGVVNVFLLFYALIRRRLFRLQMLASSHLRQRHTLRSDVCSVCRCWHPLPCAMVSAFCFPFLFS